MACIVCWMLLGFDVCLGRFTERAAMVASGSKRGFGPHRRDKRSSGAADKIFMCSVSWRVSRRPGASSWRQAGALQPYLIISTLFVQQTISGFCLDNIDSVVPTTSCSSDSIGVCTLSALEKCRFQGDPFQVHLKPASFRCT